MLADTSWSLFNFWSAGNDREDFQARYLKAAPRENCEISLPARDDRTSLQRLPGSRTARDLTQIPLRTKFRPKAWMQTGISLTIVSRPNHLPFFTALQKNNWDCFHVQKGRYPSEVCNPINLSFIWPCQNPSRLGSEMKLGNEHWTAIAESFVFKRTNGQQHQTHLCWEGERMGYKQDLITSGGKLGIKVWVSKHSS